MQVLSLGINKEKESLYRWAYVLAVITIFYNILEGLVSKLVQDSSSYMKPKIEGCFLYGEILYIWKAASLVGISSRFISGIWAGI
jgi:hypothetical protein